MDTFKKRSRNVSRIVYIMLVIMIIPYFSCQQRSLQMKNISLEKDVNSYGDDVHREERPYKCDVGNCNKAFISRVCLEMHKSFIKHFKCDLCDEEFFSETDFDDHELKNHKGKNLLKCDLCGAEFNNKDRLQRHERIYTKSFFQCNDCDEDFYNNSDLETHQKK